MSASQITICSRVSSVKRNVSNSEISRNIVFYTKNSKHFWHERFKLTEIGAIAASLTSRPGKRHMEKLNCYFMVFSHPLFHETMG